MPQLKVTLVRSGSSPSTARLRAFLPGGHEIPNVYSVTEDSAHATPTIGLLLVDAVVEYADAPSPWRDPAGG